MNREDTAQLTPPVNESRDNIHGPKKAPVTLLEYGDYECSYCGQAYSIIKNVQNILGNSLRFVFRNFPITQSHPHAQHTAEAAECAGAQSKFWEMHDILYEHQQALDDKHLEKYAEVLDLDKYRFKNDMSNHIYASRVREDFLSGVRSGVNGTPCFYINGLRYDNSWDFEALVEILKSHIKKHA
jgi:protein-disulfide isomerase